MKTLSTIFAIPFAIGLMTSSITAHSANAVWIGDGGRGSCLNVCRGNNLTPVVSGNYSRSGREFYVCTGNAGGEGNRAGYNLEPSRSRSCTVGWGNKEITVNPYECLCQ